MNSKEIFKGTMQFPIKLMLLRLASAGVALVLCLVISGISLAVGSANGFFAGIAISILIYAILNSVLTNYIGYMFKYGSIYAIMNAYADGEISPTYFNDSVDYIKNDFLKPHIYLVVDKAVSAAVKGITRIVNFIIGFLPDNIKNIADLFLNIYLNYIDECCLAYSMYHDDQNVAESTCDALVLYYQNAKGFLMPALKTTLLVVVVEGGISLLGFFICMLQPIVGFILWLLMISVSTPFIDHKILCTTVCEFLEYSFDNEVQYDLYDKLSKIKAFKKIQDKIGNEDWEPAINM